MANVYPKLSIGQLVDTNHVEFSSARQALELYDRAGRNWSALRVVLPYSLNTVFKSIKAKLPDDDFVALVEDWMSALKSQWEAPISICDGRITICRSWDGAVSIADTLDDGIENDMESTEYDENDVYRAALDGLTSLVLAHASAGVDVSSLNYQEGVNTAIEAITNQYA